MHGSAAECADVDATLASNRRLWAAVAVDLVYPRHEELTPMEWTKQGDLRVMDRVRAGGLSRRMTDGF
jgi:hypothetical protein